MSRQEIQDEDYKLALLTAKNLLYAKQLRNLESTLEILKSSHISENCETVCILYTLLKYNLISVNELYGKFKAMYVVTALAILQPPIDNVVIYKKSLLYCLDSEGAIILQKSRDLQQEDSTSTQEIKGFIVSTIHNFIINFSECELTLKIIVNLKKLISKLLELGENTDSFVHSEFTSVEALLLGYKVSPISSI